MKYKFTGKTKIWKGIKVQRIQRLSDGKIGGWIEKEENLSHEGNCWVGDKAVVCGDAQVFGNAYIHRTAQVFGDTQIYDNAIVKKGLIYDTEIYGNARVEHCNRIHSSKIYGNAVIDIYPEKIEECDIYGDVLIQITNRQLKLLRIYGNENNQIELKKRKKKS